MTEGKLLDQTYIYSKTGKIYDERLIKFITTGTRIDTASSAFEDVLYNVKRTKISNALTKILTSKNTVLIIDTTPLPKFMKFLVMKDILDKTSKNELKVKLFLDVSEYITYKDGIYNCVDLKKLVAFTIAGMVAYIYRFFPDKFTLNSSIIHDGADCFARFFSFVIDKLYKITSIQEIKKKVDYLSAMYYYANILNNPLSQEAYARQADTLGKEISGLDDVAAKYVNMEIKPEDFANIDTFVKMLGRIFRFGGINISIISHAWVNQYGPGTPFALEFFPAFAAMITNAYNGGYIEGGAETRILSIGGSLSLPAFSKTILKIGEELV